MPANSRRPQVPCAADRLPACVSEKCLGILLIAAQNVRISEVTPSILPIAGQPGALQDRRVARLEDASRPGMLPPDINRHD